MNPSTKHPDSAKLALFAGSDLALGPRILTAWHIRGCAACAAQVKEFQAARSELNNAGEAIPEALSGMDWSVLEGEIRANVRLGLSVGMLAGDSKENQPIPIARWRWAAVCVALMFVFLAGRQLRTPAGDSDRTAATISNPARGEESKIQLLVPVSDTGRTEADFSGGARSRAIDADTGQVTLQQVYAQ
jgi:hypothetical protein